MIKVDKALLLKNMIQQLEEDLKTLRAAARATHEAATHEESKPENKYDTRALEAGYLAGAQAQRVAEVEEAIHFCKSLKLRSFGLEDPIQVSALVKLQSEDKLQHVLLMPKGAGMALFFEGLEIKVITGQSPFGRALTGQEVGQIIKVKTSKGSKEYEILEVQ